MNQKSPQPPEPQNIGKGMITAAWIIGLILLTLVFNSYLSEKNNPNQHVVGEITADGTREVILKRNPYGHYVSRGTINNKFVVFLVDTGATNVSIPERVAERLGLERGMPMLAETANGTVTTYSTRLDTISIGNIELSRVSADINPGMEGDEILLGMSFLKQLEFTQRGNMLILKQYSKNY